VAGRPKELRHAVELDPDGTLRVEDGTPLEPPEGWTPEHLLLAALVRCSLKSLRHHAARAGIELTAASGGASSVVTKRESDARYAVVSADVSLAVDLDPLPAGSDLGELLRKAERDCFVGASLQARPSYRWTVAGTAVDSG
jgi:organic hydroperoxide reductase OsmC/OhrA